MLTSLQKTAYFHAVVCMIAGIGSAFIAVVEIIVTKSATIHPVDTNVMTLVLAGQVMSLTTPMSMALLAAQMKRQLCKNPPSEMVETVTILIIVTLFAVTLNVPPIIKSWYNSTMISLTAWVWIVVYTIAISVGLLIYAGAIRMFVLSTLIGEDERANAR